MELSTLKAHIKTKQFDNFYIFTGPEIQVMRIYLENMAKAYDADLKNIDSITDLAKKAHNVSMLQSAFIYTLYESSEFIQDSEISSKITSLNAFKNSIVVFIYSSIDKRSKIYKNMQDHIVDFQPLKTDILLKYVQRDIELSTKFAEHLINICENDYSRILLEIDKIKRFADARKISCDLAMRMLIESGTINEPPYDAVFDFVDAVLMGKSTEAFRLLRVSLDANKAILILLSNLYTSAKQLLQVQSYNGADSVSSATGLTPFQVKLANPRRGHNSNGDLVYLMRLIRDAEKRIKIGEIDESYAVDYVLTNYWS